MWFGSGIRGRGEGKHSRVDSVNRAAEVQKRIVTWIWMRRSKVDGCLMLYSELERMSLANGGTDVFALFGNLAKRSFGERRDLILTSDKVYRFHSVEVGT